MKAFINASKDFYNNPQKYKAKPKLPKYKHKTTGRCLLIFTNQQINFKEGYIHFPKSTNIPPLKTHLNLETPEQDDFSFSKSIESPIRQLRIIPLLNSYRIELVYTKEIQLPTYETNQEPHNIASIDLGINNFATVVTYGSRPYRPLILNGKGLKSYNKNFNKKLATLKSVAKQSNNKYSTKAIQALYSKKKQCLQGFLPQSITFHSKLLTTEPSINTCHRLQQTMETKFQTFQECEPNLYPNRLSDFHSTLSL
jgi:putative transposase